MTPLLRIFLGTALLLLAAVAQAQPVRIDPIERQPTDADARVAAGHALATAGDTLLIGAPRARSPRAQPPPGSC